MHVIPWDISGLWSVSEPPVLLELKSEISHMGNITEVHITSIDGGGRGEGGGGVHFDSNKKSRLELGQPNKWEGGAKEADVGRLAVTEPACCSLLHTACSHCLYFLLLGGNLTVSVPFPAWGLVVQRDFGNSNLKDTCLLLSNLL